MELTVTEHRSLKFQFRLQFFLTQFFTKGRASALDIFRVACVPRKHNTSEHKEHGDDDVRPAIENAMHDVRMHILQRPGGQIREDIGGEA